MRTVTAYLQSQSSDGASQDPASQWNAIVLNSTKKSAGFYMGDARLFSVNIQCPATGTPSGTLTLEACNDMSRGLDERPDPDVGGGSDVRWVAVKFLDASDALVASIVVSGASSVMMQVKDCTYRWLRVVWTNSSGSATITATAQKKGWV
jgi:hypothetical protein